MFMRDRTRGESEKKFEGERNGSEVSKEDITEGKMLE